MSIRYLKTIEDQHTPSMKWWCGLDRETKKGFSNHYLGKKEYQVMESEIRALYYDKTPISYNQAKGVISEQCALCVGRGKIDAIVATCNVPVSKCCGGCDEPVDCPECEGSGEKEIECEGY